MKNHVKTMLNLLPGKQKISNKKARNLLLSSGLFQESWYCRQYPDVNSSGLSPIDHYLKVGEAAGCWPNLYFDPTWYQGHATGAQKFTGPLLLHYYLLGWRNGRDPSRNFSTRLYQQEYPMASTTEECPLAHYLQQGQYTNKAAFPRSFFYADNREKLITDARTLAESGIFYRDWYQAYYADFWVGGSPTDPLIHFITEGHAQNRKPNPVFDSQWYKLSYPDIEEPNPALHYIREGEQNGCQPAANFCPTVYYQQHPTLDPGTTSALAHYLKHGFAQGKMPPAATKRKKAGHAAALPVDPGLRGMIEFEKNALVPEKKHFDKSSLRIHWVIPDFAAGGGGHMTIFRMTNFLERMGHRLTLWIYNPSMHESEASAHDDILKHFQHFEGKVRFLDKRFTSAKGDVVIATDCWTVWPVLSAVNFKRRFYFVQDYEPAFHPVGAHSLAAEQTYHEDLDCICASPWLEQLMREKYGRWARSFWLAADTETYFPTPRKQENKRPRIAFYARHFTARRAVELGLLALEELARKGVSFEVDFFGAPVPFTSAPFPYKDHGVAAPEDLARIFQKADMGVVFSATNYSLVPQEMMACGLPIVELNGDSTKAIFPEGTVTLADPHPRAIAEALESLISNQAKRRKQAKAALDWVRSFSWEKSAALVEKALLDRLFETYTDKKKAPRNYHIQAATGIKASIVIPTLNAGPVFEKVLAGAVAQATGWPFEILVIDSGSTDGTLDIVRQHPTVRLHQIDKKDFNHGGTRNLGVELTSGDFIAFLTHDALPANDRWLHNIVTAIERFPNAAGAFGKHLAWPEASAFTKRDLNAHFTHMAATPLCLSRDTNKSRYENGDRNWRQRLHFYSDNNSCMRRTVWKKIPYRPIKFGEDQVWADDVIRAGYATVYAVQATVYHSHDFNEAETQERSMTEAAFFKHFFDYTLIKDEAALLQAIKDQNAHDEAWGKEHKLSKAEIETRKALNVSRFTGYLAGVQADTSTMF